MGMEKIYPKPCAKKYTTFSTERIVALWCVNEIVQESYDFAASSRLMKVSYKTPLKCYNTYSEQ
jgi:hypothetical protein